MKRNTFLTIGNRGIFMGLFRRTKKESEKSEIEKEAKTSYELEKEEYQSELEKLREVFQRT